MTAITITIFSPQELNHSSYIQAGLLELEKENFISLNFKVAFKRYLGTIRIIDNKTVCTPKPHPKTCFYEFKDNVSGQKFMFATDLYDASSSFSKYALEKCAFVFKRNYEQSKVDLLPQKYQNKIYSLGLTFKVVPNNNKFFIKLKVGLFLSNFLVKFKLNAYSLYQLKTDYVKLQMHWNSFKESSKLSDFEFKSTQLNSSILFQTWCFDSEESIDAQVIHKQRYTIIKSLKQNFPNLFKGGFIPSKIATIKYSDALTNIPTNQIDYIRQIQKSKYVIYTRGLQNSPAWKMAEYLSQGKVILAERLSAELPLPLIHRKDVLFFDNESHAVKLLNETMNNDKLCELLAENSRKYFDKNVHPKENVRRIINLMKNVKSETYNHLS